MLIKFTSKKFEPKVLIAILTITLLVYLNHFDNPFFFDDTHTISNNESIRSLDNWTSFFTNADTFSSLPANRAYRPMITLMNAIDYAIAGGLNPTYYHYHIFFWFLVLIVLVYILSKHLYKLSLPKYKWLGITALFSTAWFALHTANAETINYICARSDSFSTLCIVASLLLYIHPLGRKWYLYIATMIIGIWTKQTGVMFVPLLLVYILLFEEYSLITDYKTDPKKKISAILKKIAPAMIIAFFLFIFNQYYLTPKTTDSTNFTVTRFEYISTQWYVILNYLGNFILPINLSADPDTSIIKPWYDIRILSGLTIILGMLFLMTKTALKKELRPISFGISWFFIALLPTTLNPLFQIANDHRMFFPFIGLFIAIPWGIFIVLKDRKIGKKSKPQTISITIALGLLLAGHAYGTIQRNKVWNSEESLWLDVSVKSPKNGRGLMNYGLTHMAKGNYEIALEYFKKADKLSPNYYTLHINLAILYGAIQNHTKAEEYFKSAINLNANSPSPEYYYGRYLSNQKKYQEAEKHLEKALENSPNHIQSKKLLTNISNMLVSPKKEIADLEEKAKKTPSLDVLLNLSLKYYQNKEYQMVVNTSEKLLKSYPNTSTAYNNMCAAYNQMKKWKLGAEACKKAIKINPEFQLAKNNLKWATDNINN